LSLFKPSVLRSHHFLRVTFKYECLLPLYDMQRVRPYVRRRPGRHRFTKAEIEDGIRKSLRSKKTPPHLKKGLYKYAKKKGIEGIDHV